MKAEIYCFSCETQLRSHNDNFGPICAGCYKKTKRRDPLTAAAIAKRVVAVVPMICPHADERKHKCRFCRASAAYFNVIILDKNLEPVEITGPYTSKAAEKRAKELRKKKHRD